jgi:ABC-type Mn2+/Zn2+ transport system ATPase subunit
VSGMPGKTSFLTCLAGRASYGVASGKVLVNGEEASVATFRKLVGFVTQEDIMSRQLVSDPPTKVFRSLMHGPSMLIRGWVWHHRQWRRTLSTRRPCASQSAGPTRRNGR